MTTFDRREEAFENMFAHDEEMRFKAEARRARQLALWAAGLMKKDGAAVEAYADEVVHAMIENGGDEALFTRIASDLRAAGDSTPPDRIHDTMHTLMAEAIHHVRST